MRRPIPEWYNALSDMPEEKQEKFRQRNKKMHDFAHEDYMRRGFGKWTCDEYKEDFYKQNYSCKCDIKITEPLHEFCINCWKLVFRDDWDFSWCLDRKAGENEYWLYIDNETYEASRKYWPQTRCKIWESLRLYFFDLQEGKCADCKKSLEQEKMELHHIIPLSKGGSDFLDNLKLLCKQCHYKYIWEALPDE